MRYLSIKKLNKTLANELRIKLISFEDFKKIHKGHGGFDGAVANIDSVEWCSAGYYIKFDNGSSFTVYYSGHMQKDDNNPVKNYDRNSGRIRVNGFGGYNGSVYPEKIIGVCQCVINNEMPESFNGLVVNVLDGSGHEDTATELGIKYNIHESNLEWTTRRRNSQHGQAIRTLFDICGRAYRYSANDPVLYDALDIKQRKPMWIRHYMMSNYIAVD